MMHVVEVDDDHAAGNDKFKEDSYAEDDGTDDNVQLSFNMMDHRGETEAELDPAEKSVHCPHVFKQAPPLIHPF